MADMTPVTPATLVTGGAGFIGSHLVDRLLAAGERVVVLDDLNDYYSPAQKLANLRQARLSPLFQFVEGDIRDPAAVRKAFSHGPVRRLVHLAARAGVRPSLVNPVLYADVNVTGSAVLLEACVRHDVGHVVFASSSSVYGACEKVPFVESEYPLHPISPYAATKLANELQCWTFNHLTGRSVTCLRFFTAIGPRNRPDMALWRFSKAILEGSEITLYGNGTMRDFTYVNDIVDGVIAALERPRGMLICNLGGGQPVLVKEVIAGLESRLGRAARVRTVALPAGDVPVTWADCSRAEHTLGWSAKTGLPDALDSFVAWFLEEHAATPGLVKSL